MAPGKHQTAFRLSIIILSFLAAAGIFYVLIFYLPQKLAGVTSFSSESKDFVSRIHTELNDLGKSFLTILVAVFVASVTFSEKIVNISLSTRLAKALLITCWLFLLLSIVLDGVGILDSSLWYANEMNEHASDNDTLITCSVIFFNLSGIFFGLALTSMFAAGIISITAKSQKAV